MPARSELRWLALVLLATFAAYAPSLANGYAMDDRFIAMGVDDRGRKNPMVYDLQPLGAYFREHYWKGHVATDDLFRPVTVWSYAVIHHLSRPPEPDFEDREQKETAFPQHLVNVLLHLTAVVIAWGLLRGLRVRPGPALVGALVFGLHAVHSEVVSGVVGRAELFAFVFGGGAVWLLFGAGARGRAGKILAGAAGACLFFLAFCSKENAAGWIGFLAVYGLAFQWRHRPGAPGWRPAATRLATHLAVAAVPFALFLWLRWRVIHGFPPTPVAYVVNPLDHIPWLHRVATAVFIWGFQGLGLTLFPFDLACDYGSAVFPLLTSLLDPRFLLTALVLLAVLLGGLAAAVRRPLLFVATAVFLGFSFITSNLPLMVGTVFGERLYYTPSLGLAFLAAWLCERARSRPRLRPALAIATALWLGASTLVILERDRVWNSDTDLFLADAARQPRSTRLRVCAAGIHSDRGEKAAALRHLEAAVRLDPDYALAWNNIGAIYLDLGRLDEAEECIRAGLGSRHIDEKEDGFKLHCNLALVLERTGRRDEAFPEFLESLQRNPDFARSWNELLALVQEDAKGNPGSFPRLFAAIGKRERDDPDDPHWPYYRGLALAAVGRAREASEALQAALGRDPGFEKARIEFLALAGATRPPDEVLRLAEEGKSHAPEFPHWPFHRGLALARAGRTIEALRAFAGALRLDPNFATAWQALLAEAERTKRLDDAVAVIRECEARRPFGPHWPYFRGLLRARQGKTGEAMDALGRALRLRPDFAAAWHELWALARGGPGFQKVLELADRGADEDRTGSPRWPYYRGLALNALGAAARAVGAFEEALARDPTFHEARLELLELVHRVYRPETVRRLLREGIVFHPEDPHWPLYRGLLLHREHRWSAARRTLEKALRGLPGHPAARLARAECLAHLGLRREALAASQALAADGKAPGPWRERAREAAARLGGPATKSSSTPGARRPR